jgi:hypothetical protein
LESGRGHRPAAAAGADVVEAGESQLLLKQGILRLDRLSGWSGLGVVCKDGARRCSGRFVLAVPDVEALVGFTKTVEIRRSTLHMMSHASMRPISASWSVCSGGEIF